MLYLLKHLLLLNLVIFKLKCNNFIFNEIMVLNASFVCLPHSHFIEDHPIWILEDRPIISEVVWSHARKFHSIWVILNRLTKSAHFIPVNTNYKVQKYAKIYIAHYACTEFRR
jgi:hypothetical protein